MTAPEPIHCAECGAELPAGLPRGLCSRCALKGALELGGASKPAMEDSACASVLPRLFGDYELLEEIARGGMGVVYKARQISLNRTVAVKMILAGEFASAEFISRFRIEATATAALQHPNIVAIHEVGVQQGQHYFAMDLVDGPNLARMVRDGPLPARRAAGYVKAIAEAIHFAHARRILHRDLKPSNVLIDSNDRPRLTDFGLAKNLATDSNLTVTGEIHGTPSFMPPEQASGERGKIGVTSDVYSLGAILYHALTRRPPFVGQTVAETLKQVENNDPIAPRLLEPGLPRDLETICLKCLEKDPQRRYATAGDLAEDLGRYLSNQPVLARPTGPVFRGARWARRNPAAAGLIAALVLALGVLSGLIKALNDRRQADLEAVASIRAMVIRNIDEMWQRPDKTSERIGSEQLAALAGKRKSHAPAGAMRLRLGLGATEAPVDRATMYQPMLDFMERRMERLLGRAVRLDLVLSKEVRLDKFVAQDSLDLARIGALAFIRARQADPRLEAIAQENAPKDAVIFALVRSGITNLSQVRSIAFADTNSTISAWAKVFLARAGIRASNLVHHANLPSPITDLYAHREAVRAVLAGRFEAGVARPAQLASEVGVEGRDWVALLRFDSSQTLWATGGSVPEPVRKAFQTVLIELTGQQHLILPDRVRNLLVLDARTLRELEEALERDLRSFDSAPGSEVGGKAP